MQRITTTIATIATVVLLATSAFADAEMKATYKVSADELWKLVEFHQPSENIMPPVASSKVIGNGIGARKLNILTGGAELNLQLVYFDPKSRAFNYVVQKGPAPVKNYVGEVRVTDVGEGRAQLSWRGVFDPDGVDQAAADAAIMGFYTGIFGKIGETYTREETQD